MLRNITHLFNRNDDDQLYETMLISYGDCGKLFENKNNLVIENA